jgi:hypothetical protein
MKIKDQIQELREQIARLTMHLVNKNEVLREQAFEIASIKEQNRLMRAHMDETRLTLLALFLQQDIDNPVYYRDFATLYYAISGYFFNNMADKVYPAVFALEQLTSRNVCMHALYEQMKDNNHIIEHTEIKNILEQASQYRAAHQKKEG